MLTVAENLVHELARRGFHISFAESCTGGRAAAAIVDVPDASKVLDASFVTYANEAKIKYLNVSPATIADHGVVSEEVVAQMAAGVAKEAGAEVGIAVSGIAGPGGGTEKKPVGMVCFGFYVDGQIITKTCLFGNPGRNEVRNSSAEYAIKTTLELITKQEFF